jgi:hypothetical protein
MVKGEASELWTNASWGKLAGDSFRRRSFTFSHSPEVSMRYFYCWNENHFDVTKTKPLLQTLTPSSAGINFFVFTTTAFFDLKILRQRVRLAL